MAKEKLDEISEAIKGVEQREANIRTGWVYYSQEPEALEWRTGRRLARASSDEPAWPTQAAS